MTGLFWSGCYSHDLGGTGEGIGALRRQPDGNLRYLGTVATAVSPSFLINHPRRSDLLYACLEGGAGIVALRRTAELTFEAHARQPTSGALPCHGSIAADGAALFIASYGNGTLASHPLAADGAPGPHGTVLTFTGSGPHADQAHARGHAAAVVDSSTLINLDLGTDEVRLFGIGPHNELRQLQCVRLPPGSGPRDLLVHSSGFIFVLTELSNEIFVLSLSPQRSELSVVGSSPLAGTTSLDGSHAAGLSQSADGRYVYAGTRGAGVVVTFCVRNGGRRLERIAATPTGGTSPRHSVVDGAFLHVCNELSSTIASFALNPRTGVPGPIGAPEPVPSPTLLLRAAPW